VELTTLVHGEEETRQAVAASQALFGRGSLSELSVGTLRSALAEAGLWPVHEPQTLSSLLRITGLVASANEARRTIAEGGAYLNNTRITDGEAVPAATDLLHDRFLVLRRGKRTFAGVDYRI
jgi:tyrosyl-tRNA synthetase